MRKKNYKGKILKTSDGYLRGSILKYKNRLIVVINQRKDGAIAVSKIHSIEGKNSTPVVKTRATLDVNSNKNPKQIATLNFNALRINHSNPASIFSISLPFVLLLDFELRYNR